MAFRSDVSINWLLSPRLVRVAAPSKTITIQDLYDTLRQLEDDIWNASYPSIVAAGGKESLGGGDSVGVTLKLDNALLAFESRTTSTSIGSITTGDATGLVLKDSAATFLSDGVLPGASVINLTDGSAGIALIVAEDQLTLDAALTDGTDNQWDVSDSYKVWNTEAMTVTDGNIVAVDANGAPLDPPIHTTFATQVTIAQSTSPSASLVDSGFTDADRTTLDATLTEAELVRKVGTNRLEVDIASQELRLYDDDGTTLLQRWPLRTTGGEAVKTGLGVQTKRKAPLL